MASPGIHPPLATLSKSFAQFTSSSSTFKVISTVPSSINLQPPKSIFILDSSFNPPTTAHLHLALSALNTTSPLYPSPRRLLLLLSTQNADKAPKPASFEHRLAMMWLLAQDINMHTRASEENSVADIGLTTEPYFNRKSRCIEESGVYGTTGEEPTHVHLIGYDTLIRLFDTKYYPPSHSLGVLEPFMEKHSLRVHLRPGEWGEGDEQDRWIQSLENRLDGAVGLLEERGGKKEWVNRMEIVKPRKGEDGEGVSSSLVRKTVVEGGSLDGLITERVREYIKREGLYNDQG